MGGGYNCCQVLRQEEVLLHPQNYRPSVCYSSSSLLREEPQRVTGTHPMEMSDPAGKHM